MCHCNLCCTSLCCTSLCCTSLCSIFLCCASVCYTLLCCKDATCTVPQYANSRLFPAIAFVSLQLELHLLMVHLLMVHLPMVHLHVLHLLAMHLIGLQLVQCIDTPTVVFRLQLIMHHCNLVDPSKGWRRASGEEKNSWRHSCLGHQHPRLGARAEHHYHRFPWSWTLFPQVSTFGTTMSYHIWDNHVEYFML